MSGFNLWDRMDIQQRRGLLMMLARAGIECSLTPEKETTVATGWGNPDPYSSRSKFHYFTERGISLCGRWGNPFGQITLEQGKDDHPDNCAACRAKLQKTVDADKGQGK